MSVRIHFLSNNPKIHPFEKALTKTALATVKHVQKLLSLKNIDIVLSYDPDGAVTEYGGIGGYTPDAHRVLISIDPKATRFRQRYTQALTGTIAHELHHAVRWVKPGYGETLLEACVTEGLADHFVSEAFPALLSAPWTHALTSKSLKTLLARAAREVQGPYDHAAWFFGSTKKRIPRWSGYSIGFEIVRQYLTTHPKEKPSTLVHRPASVILSSLQI